MLERLSCIRVPIKETNRRTDEDFDSVKSNGSQDISIDQMEVAEEDDASQVRLTISEEKTDNSVFTGKSTTRTQIKHQFKPRVPGRTSLVSSGAVSQIEIRGKAKKQKTEEAKSPKQHGISEQGMGFVDGYSSLVSYMQHTNI